MDRFQLVTLAEIRRAELLQQAEQNRLAHHAASFNPSPKPYRIVLRDELVALCARVNAMRRPVLSKPSDLAPAASGTA